MTTPSDLSYRTIPLSQGRVAIVDAEDYDRLMEHKWHAHLDVSNQKFYALRNSIKIKGKQIKIPMHREVMKLEPRDHRRVDHRNHLETLDNRKQNLRFATTSQNGANRGKQANNSSGFKGVTFHKDSNKWQAQIGKDGKVLYLGLFTTASLAHNAYCAAAAKFHGEFMRTI